MYVCAEHLIVLHQLCRSPVERIAREVLFLMFAGTDTTSFNIIKVVQLLAQHPDWFDKVKQEQEAIIADIGDDLGREVRPLHSIDACTLPKKGEVFKPTFVMLLMCL